MPNKKYSLLLVTIIAAVSCTRPSTVTTTQPNTASDTWQQQLDKILPLLGHRNWVVIVDKAFPQQTAIGMEVINTNESLLPVLQYALHQINASAHVRPIIYRDKELSFITEDAAKGVNKFVAGSQQLFNGQSVQTILHDSVFTKLAEASKTFKVIVLKTNEAIPYTSVFLQLDCAYWDKDKEKALRSKMESQHDSAAASIQ